MDEMPMQGRFSRQARTSQNHTPFTNSHCQKSARFQWVSLEEMGNAMEGSKCVELMAHVIFSCKPSRDVQPYQCSVTSGQDGYDTPLSPAVEHNTSGHLRFDGNGTVDAQRSTTVVGTRVAGELVYARLQNDPVNWRMVEGRQEFLRRTGVQ